MASGVCRYGLSWSWYRCAINFKNKSILSPNSFSRSISNSTTGEKEGLLKRIKKYTFGEEPPRQQTDIEFEESYYELSRSQEPLVYRMDNEEIYSKLERIVSETIPEVGVDWRSRNINDITMKYKLLSKCYKEFGLLVPNYQLGTMSRIQEVFNFYTSARPKDKRTFKSINMDDLPPNLIIGGKVPRKEMS